MSQKSILENISSPKDLKILFTGEKDLNFLI